MNIQLVIFSSVFTFITFLLTFDINLRPFATISLAVVGISIGIYSKFNKKCFIYVCLCFFAVITSYFYYNIFVSNNYSQVDNYDGNVVQVYAVVKKFPEMYPGRQRVELEINNELGKNFRALVYFDKDHSFKVGDVLHCDLKFYKPTHLDGFDREEFYKAKDIFILAINKNLIDIKDVENVPFWAIPQYLAQSMKRNSQELFSKFSGIISALLLGDKKGLSNEFLNSLRVVGASHLIAVSGMHVGFLISVIILIFGRKLGSIIGILVVFMFVPMVSSTPSVMRAGIMYIFLCVSQLVGRKNSSINALFVALLIILLRNPFSIRSASLQLSFLATLGILLFSSRLYFFLMSKVEITNSVLLKPVKFFVASISCSIGATVLTVPVLMQMFGYITLLSPITNLLLIPLASFIFPMSMICVGMYGFLPTVSYIMSLILSPFLNLFVLCVEILSKVPNAIIYTDTMYAVLAVALIYGLIVCIYFTRNHRKTIVCVSCIFVLFIAISIYMCKDDMNNLRIEVIPSGTGQCIIMSNGKRCVVIDCGGSGAARDSAQEVMDYTKRWGYDKIDTLIITSAEYKFIKDVPKLIGAIDVDNIIMPKGTTYNSQNKLILRTINDSQCNIIRQAIGDNLQMFGGTKIHIYQYIPKRLIICLETEYRNILIAHSLSLNMLYDFIKFNNIKCDTIMISSAILADQNPASQVRLNEILINSEASSLIVQSSKPIYWQSDKISLYSTLEKGRLKIVQRR